MKIQKSTPNHVVLTLTAWATAPIKLIPTAWKAAGIPLILAVCFSPFLGIDEARANLNESITSLSVSPSTVTAGDSTTVSFDYKIAHSHNDTTGFQILLDGTTVLDSGTNVFINPGSPYRVTFSISRSVAIPAGTSAGAHFIEIRTLFSVTQTFCSFDTANSCRRIATIGIIVEPPDDDGDGVLNDSDMCPDTVIPEGAPSGELNPNHWALTEDGNGFDFDTVLKGKGKGPNRSYTIEDTAGCSCEQIIDAQGLGNGHTYQGCSIGAMDNWVELMNP